MRRKIIYLIIIILVNLNVYAEGEATLKFVKVNGTECSCSGYECYVEVNSKKATITYELEDSKAKVDRMSGFSVDLDGQITVVKIVVSNNESEEKIENTYNVNITLHEKSNDYTLSSLKVNDDDIKLLDDVYVYNYQADYDVDTLKVDAKTNDKNAKVLEPVEFKFDLERSSISIDFEVQAENGEKKSYRVFVTRKNKPDTTLKSLKLDHGNINFNKDVLEYSFKVDYSVNDLIIEAIPNNDNATVKIEKDTLVVGENVIKIIVTNEKAIGEYILNVEREPNMDKSLANLSSLKVLEFPKLNFDENILEYTLNFDDIPEKLSIDAKSQSSDGRIEILYNEKLKGGSKVVVRNTLIETGIEREYVLNIVHEEKITNSKIFIVIAITFIIIIIVVMLMLEIREKKINRHKKLTKILELKKKKDKEKKKKINGKVKNTDDDLEII